MATVTAQPQAPAEPSLLQARHRAVADPVFRLVSLACGLLVLVILALIAVSMTSKALPALRYAGLSFVTSSVWNPAAGQYGALAFVWGTLVTSLIAVLIGVPVSLGIALLLTEVAPRAMRTPVIYLVDLLAAIPSVVYGLWALLVLVSPIDRVYGSIENAVSGIPVLDTLFGGGHTGKAIFTAGLILALMITPIVTSLSREVFATVPRAQKEAALALGATRWEMIRGSVLSYGRSGVVGSVMLGLARAMGETIAVALIVGSSPQVTAHLFRSGDTMAAVIANQFNESTQGSTYQSALIALGVLLFALTIAVNLAARAVLNRSEKQLGAAL